ncbi:MAG: 1-phosphofructokinase family hexose kinase [Deferribacterota bacterium]|nr:1-phosphofructokinase family hexose kinase [Deferribacterota bacterium]
MQKWKRSKRFIKEDIVITITLNPAIDVILYVDELYKGKLNRVDKYVRFAAGKGINVASFLSDLGFKNISVTGFLGEKNKYYFLDYFKEKSLNDNFIYYNGYTRENYKIVEDSTNVTTEVNTESIYREKLCLGAMQSMIEEFAPNFNYFVFSGSVPPTFNSDVYYKLGKIAVSKNKKVIIDTSGIALKEALRIPPFAIKPNYNEYCELLNKSSLTIKEIVESLKYIHNKGVEYVLLTMGEKGALISTRDAKIFVKGVPDKINSTTCAGDAFLSGFLYGIINNCSLEEIAKLSTASSLSLLSSFNRQLENILSLERYYKNIEVEHIS